MVAGLYRKYGRWRPWPPPMSSSASTQLGLQATEKQAEDTEIERRMPRTHQGQPQGQGRDVNNGWLNGTVGCLLKVRRRTMSDSRRKREEGNSEKLCHLKLMLDNGSTSTRKQPKRRTTAVAARLGLEHRCKLEQGGCDSKMEKERAREGSGLYREVLHGTQAPNPAKPAQVQRDWRRELLRSDQRTETSRR